MRIRHAVVVIPREIEARCSSSSRSRDHPPRLVHVTAASLRTERGVNTRWGALLIVPFVISAALLFGSQIVFLEKSFFVDLAFGRKAAEWSFGNYARIVSDPYYLRTLWLTTYISLCVAAVCIGLGFPIAKVLARLRSRWTTFLLSAIVLTSFITTVIQIFGLIIIFRADGPINKWRAENQIAPRKAIQSSPQLEQQQLASLTRQFPTPRLETDDGNQDLADLHDRENLLLENYSWIDRGKGTVRIAIERVMQIIAQKGLPVAPQEQEQAAMVGDSRPTVQMPLTDGYAPTAYEQQLHGETAQPGEQSSARANNK